MLPIIPRFAGKVKDECTALDAGTKVLRFVWADRFAVMAGGKTGLLFAQLNEAVHILDPAVCRNILIGLFASLLAPNRKTTLQGWSFCLEQGTGVVCIFAFSENKCSARSSPRRQRSSALHFIIRFPLLNKETTPQGWSLYLEQGTGVEPAFTAWEAVVLPIYEPCVVWVL